MMAVEVVSLEMIELSGSSMQNEMLALWASDMCSGGIVQLGTPVMTAFSSKGCERLTSSMRWEVDQKGDSSRSIS